MAVDYEVQTPERLQGRLAPVESHVQLANTTIYAGTLTMLVSGKTRPAASGVATSTLLGIAEKTTTAGGSDVVHLFDDPIVSKRGCFGLPANPSDPPVEADLMHSIYISDNYSVKHTMASNDMAVTLIAIESANLQNPASSAGAVYFVEIK